MSGVVLGDVAEVFTHPFTQSSFGVSNILFEAYFPTKTLQNGSEKKVVGPPKMVAGLPDFGFR